jgi:4-hydroxy-3-methylbut-2-enyl diphosphate reductase
MLEVPADLAIVIGGYNSSNTSHLVELCEEDLPTYFIKDENCIISGTEISHFDLRLKTEKLTSDYLPDAGSVRILLTSGASCPDALVERVIERLAMLTGNETALEAIARQYTAVN